MSASQSSTWVSNSVQAGTGRPEHPLHAQSGREQVAQDRGEGVVRGEVGEEVGRLPVRNPRQQDLLHVAEDLLEGLPLPRRLDRQPLADLSRLDLRQDRAAARPAPGSRQSSRSLCALPGETPRDPSWLQFSASMRCQRGPILAGPARRVNDRKNGPVGRNGSPPRFGISATPDGVYPLPPA